MDSITSAEKKEVSIRVNSFSYCGFSNHITGNIRYYKSFVGRDFKAFMQMSLFIVTPYLSGSKLKCWYLLAKVCDLLYYIINDFGRYFKLYIVLIYPLKVHVLVILDQHVKSMLQLQRSTCLSFHVG